MKICPRKNGMGKWSLCLELTDAEIARLGFGHKDWFSKEQFSTREEAEGAVPQAEARWRGHLGIAAN